jgi:hypothetical protein
MEQEPFFPPADEVFQHRGNFGVQIHFSPPIVRFQVIVKLIPPRLLADPTGPCIPGRRSGPNSCLGPGNSYNGNSYDGNDFPNIPGPQTLALRLQVLDICDGGKVIYTQKWPLYEEF